MKASNTKKIVAIIVVIFIMVMGVMAVKNAQNKDANLPVVKQYPVVVSTLVAQINETQLSLPFLAQVENDKDVNISSRIAARVEYIKASGSKVKRGEVIVRLDNTSIESNNSSLNSQIEAQKVMLKNLEETHKRTEELLKIKGGASIEQFQKEESNIEGVKSKIAALKQAKVNSINNMSYATIKSPVDGIISKTLVNQGDMCMPGHPVAKLSSENGFFLMLRLPSDINLEGVQYANQYYPMVSLNSTFNGLSEYKVYLSDSTHLQSGDRFEVDVVVFKGEGINLPFDAILNRNGESFVLVKEAETAKPVPVTILQSGQEGVVISNTEMVGKELIIAKQDIMLRILGGVSVITKNQ